LPVLHYSTLCRRQATLKLVIPYQSRQGPLNLVVDSTGCKVYGEGEWKVRQHGWSQRRTWRKLHLGVDEKSGELVAVTLSTNDLSDLAGGGFKRHHVVFGIFAHARVGPSRLCRRLSFCNESRICS
jgi:hypothetical protein